ncbi:MAG: DICT sensory domain-containing protein [Verrucomicrobiota bacterium]
MIAETSNEVLTQKHFEKVLKPYLHEYEADICGLEPHKAKQRKMVRLGDRVEVPATDITHLFNNKAMLAVSHAIEDLAGEIREGELISTFQNFDNFQPQKKRYKGLAKDLDAVRVWGEGTPPKRCPQIDFIPLFREEMKRYWVVVFNSPKQYAALVCRQVNDSDEFNHKIFAGFYTFNPFVVESFRRQLNLMSVGLDSVVAEFESQFKIPMLSLKEIRDYFERDPASPA